MKICIYSGTFNPVHRAHIELVHGILDEFEFEKIIIIPNNIPPHKNGEDIVSAEHRIEMLRLAFDHPKIEISDIEIARGGTSYSYDTIRAIKEKYEIDEKISFLIGTDAMMGLKSWHRYLEVTQEVDFILAQREKDFNPMTILLNLNINGLTCILSKIPFNDVSSTELRQKIRQNENICDLTTHAVAEYIKTQNLYKTYNYYEMTEILEKEFQNELKHSEAVADFAEKLAKKFGEDETKARVAGLLHDCAKYLDKDHIKKMIAENAIDVFEHEINAPRTLHAPLGAFIAKTRFNIEDEDILNAIRYHTIGRCNMSLLEKIIFISDKIEPVTREKEFREKIEPFLEKGLDEAICKYFELLIKKLKSEGVEITNYTKEVFESIKNSN